MSAKPRRPWRKAALWLVVILAATPAAIVLLYRFIPPPVTPLMLIRSGEGEASRHQWVPLSRISPALAHAVIASEDERFCRHRGFDWQALAQSWHAYRNGRALRGASTISQQTAKNLFLWPGRSVFRKAIEAYVTMLLELLWSKSHILETYLNIVEWGHFGKSAAALTPREAALLAAVLPNPRRWSADRPTNYIEERAAHIERLMPAMVTPGMEGCR
jgi:monofunctional biosynthetic peptidoglycan transglycosylase